MKALKEEVSESHYCNNLCPCALESIFDAKTAIKQAKVG